MGFDFSNGDLSSLESFLKTRSYIDGHEPSQADVSVYKDVKSAPDASKYPNSARWYSHVTSYESEHGTLPGDASRSGSSYGPDSVPTAVKVEQAKDTTSKDAKGEEEEDIDLFGSDDDEEEDPEAVALREKRLAEYNAKKAAKGPKPAAKSIVTLDVKPWDDETDLKELEDGVRAITMDGLTIGGSTRVPLAFGLSCVRFNLVVEDEKVSIDELQEMIQNDLEDFVQSTDVAAMQKL
ncbi:hypothetical protein PYCC9005_003117 [Savitreella phatthalungensis]